MKQLIFSGDERIIFCSDVHLDDEPSDLVDHFTQQLVFYADQADVIIILGDLFNYWLGDHCQQRFNKLFKLLGQLHKHVHVYFMPGNRDFLLTSKVLNTCNIHLLSDPCLLHYGSERILLSHGDQYCSLDTGYLRLRSVLQNPFTKALARWIPYKLRYNIAQYLRTCSSKKGANKSKTTMDIYLPSVVTAMQQYQTQLFIHGHVHYLRDALICEEEQLRCITLDSWQHQSNYAFLSADGISLNLAEQAIAVQ